MENVLFAPTGRHRIRAKQATAYTPRQRERAPRRRTFAPSAELGLRPVPFPGSLARLGAHVAARPTNNESSAPRDLPHGIKSLLGDATSEPTYQADRNTSDALFYRGGFFNPTKCGEAMPKCRCMECRQPMEFKGCNVVNGPGKECRLRLACRFWCGACRYVAVVTRDGAMWTKYGGPRSKRSGRSQAERLP